MPDPKKLKGPMMLQSFVFCFGEDDDDDIHDGE